MVDQLLFLLRSPWRKPGIAGGRRVMAGVFPRLRNGLPSSLTALVALLAAPCFAAPAYDREIAPILRTYCSGCHNDHDAESEFSVERFATLRKGGAGSGDPVVPGDAAASILVQRIKSSDSDHMPPDDEPQVPAADLATLIGMGPSAFHRDRLADPDAAPPGPVTASVELRVLRAR